MVFSELSRQSREDLLSHLAFVSARVLVVLHGVGQGARKLKLVRAPAPQEAPNIPDASVQVECVCGSSDLQMTRARLLIASIV